MRSRPSLYAGESGRSGQNTPKKNIKSDFAKTAGFDGNKGYPEGYIMSNRSNSNKSLKVNIHTRWGSISLYGVGESIVLATIASLTVLGAMYIYLAFVT